MHIYKLIECAFEGFKSKYYYVFQKSQLCDSELVVIQHYLIIIHIHTHKLLVSVIVFLLKNFKFIQKNKEDSSLNSTFLP